MNGLDRVHPETRRRVLEVVEAHRYEPSAFARGLAIQRTHTLGFVIPTLSDPFYLGIVRGVEEGAAAERYGLLVVSQFSSVDDRRVLELFTQKRVDGLVIVGVAVPPEVVAQLRAQGFPLALLQQRAEGATFVVDNYGGAVQVTEHLLGLGRRRIAYIAGSDSTLDNAERFRGFRDALQRAGVPFMLELFAQGNFFQGSGRAAVEELLARRVPFDAVFAANDQMAIDALTALREHGLKVPDDVAVVGFDDIPLAQYVMPPLTTVRQPAYELGFRATRAVLAALRGEALPEQVVLPAELVVRASCGANGPPG